MLTTTSLHQVISLSLFHHVPPTTGSLLFHIPIIFIFNLNTCTISFRLFLLWLLLLLLFKILQSVFGSRKGILKWSERLGSRLVCFIATDLILEEIGRICVQMTNDEVTIAIMLEEFQYFWKKVREGAALSYSGIHCGPYKAAAHSDKILGFLAKKSNGISRTGCPPEWWSYVLTVMLEKVLRA